MADFTSEYTGPQIEQKLDDVASLNQRVSDAEGQISGLETSKYEKPADGIPKSDLASTVQSSLGKADNALQPTIVKQTTGTSTTNVMSQKAITDELGDKVDKETGKGLSTNDYTTPEKQKLAALPTNPELQEALGGKADKDPNAVEGNIAKFDANGNPVDGGIPANNVAQKDGYYEKLGAGTAKYIEGETPVTDSFMERPTGGDAEVANGLAQVTEVAGKSQQWNQLIKDSANNSTKSSVTLSHENGVFTLNGTASADNTFYLTEGNGGGTLPVGHKGFWIFVPVSGTITGNPTFKIVFSDTPVNPFAFGEYLSYHATQQDYLYIVFNSGTVFDNFTFRLTLVDLTLLGIDNLTTVAEVEAWLAENIGLKPYYPYNAGEILNNKMEGLESTNRNLLDATTGLARIIGAYSDVYGNYYGITGTHGTLTFTSDLGETSTITPDSDGKFLLEEPGWLDVATPGDDCAVFIWWDGTKTDYVEHKVSKAYVDLTHIWGKKNGTGDLVQIWPSGSPGLPGVKDILRNEGGVAVARRRFGKVDLGTLTWQAAGTTGVLLTSATAIPNIKLPPNDTTAFDGVASNRIAVPLGYGYIGGIAVNRNLEKFTLWVPDNTVTNQTGIVYYALATEEVFTDLVYQGSSHFADGTPVTLPVSLEVDNWGIERAIPQNDTDVVTAIPEISCKYSIDIVETAKTQQDEIENLDEKKANTEGSFPGIAAGSAKALEGQDVKVENFTFTPTHGADGLAKINGVRGNSIVWNQLAKNVLSDSSNYVVNGSTTASYANGKLTVSFTETGGANAFGILCKGLVATHKYAFLLRGTGMVNSIKFGGLYIGNVGTTITTFGSAIITQSNSYTDGTIWFWYAGSSVTPADMILESVDFIDLTLMFGEGKEPSTVEEFEALYNLPYYANNAGGILNNKTAQIESVGFNMWDEEWEVGIINATTGQKADNPTSIRSKNDIPVFPNTTYFYCQKSGSGSARVAFMDADKNVLSVVSAGVFNTTFVTPADCYYIRFSTHANQYGSTYNHDICINLSDPAKNGTYEPYKKVVVDLNITTLTGKKLVNGSTEGQDSVVMYPDGARAAGTEYDEIVRDRGKVRFKEVDLGTLTWSAASTGSGGGGAMRMTAEIADAKVGVASSVSNIICSKYVADTPTNVYNATSDKIVAFLTSLGGVQVLDKSYTDPAAFKAAMNGVKLIYAVAEPEEYILDTPIPDNFQAYKGGTLKQLPENGSEPTTAPCVLSLTYAIDAVGILNGLPQNYVSKESLQAMLTAMQSAGLFAGYTMTFNATTGKYEFTFTPNS